MSATPLRVLSVIPPMTQLNTPYPSTAYLTGFLRSRGVTATQEDLALALVLRLLSPDGLRAVAAKVDALPLDKHTPAIQAFVAMQPRYLATIGPVIAFLQGRDPTLAHRIVGRTFLPEGPRFASRWTCTSTRRAGTRWPGPSAHWACRTAPGTWPRST